MRYKELLIGIALGLLLFLLWQGVDILPVLLLGGVLVFLYFFSKGRLRENFEFTGHAIPMGVDTGVSFDDIGGQEVAKRELLEALDFTRDWEKVSQLGIRPLKGILLTGPPGTGKTLLAKAAASYTDSVFVSAAGSEFIEMYAGVGAQRVRKLFNKGRQLATKAGKNNAVIFIDEIEVIAGKRGSHSNHLEYDQTLNQLLVEMDGIRIDNKVRIIVVAATNRADLLDSAILRPGRFDRQVKVDLPDKEGRRHILNIHAKGKPLSREVDLDKVAGDTFGFSGAHLESLINEAAIMAFRKEHNQINMDDIKEAIDKVMLGEKLDRKVERDELRRVSIHEVGHALVSEVVRPGSVGTVTVIPRGKALGFMRPVQDREQYLYTRAYLEDQIAICLGGALAEELIYHNWSTGSANDFEQATNICKQLILTGLSELGIVREDLMGNERIYTMMREILANQQERVRRIMENQEETVKRISQVLLEEEKVSGEWFRDQLNISPVVAG